jgi:hypothetical protein
MKISKAIHFFSRFNATNLITIKGQKRLAKQIGGSSFE